VLALLVGIVGAAAVFRTPDLYGLAVLGLVSSIHVFNVRGYASLWAPPAWTVAASHAVGVGAFALAAALAWQIRQQLTTAQSHPRLRLGLNALIVVSALGMTSPFFGFYGSVAWINLVSLALCDLIAIALCMAALRRSRQQRIQHAVLLCAYALHMLAGGPIALVLMGQSGSRSDMTLVWQTEIFLFMVLVAGAIFAEMVGRYRRAEAAKDTALEHLAQSEHLLEERIELRTAELFAAQEALALALASERTLRQEQRQFFQMISHEFRTPLAVIDSAAAEQLAFPSPELTSQTERAAQIRRACRRLTSLVDSCLVNDRMDKTGFTLHAAPVVVTDLLEHAAQLVRWSPRHRLHLFTQAAPPQWVCDAALVRIALSNLVDNAVKYAKAGEIFITAVRNDAGQLELSVADDGSGISLEVMNKMFEQFERGNRTDQARGFGLGLWVARRIARLHGGDIQVESTQGQGTCFTLTIANQKIAA
jgi:signal transduction histidine kinase